MEFKEQEIIEAFNIFQSLQLRVMKIVMIYGYILPMIRLEN